MSSLIVLCLSSYYRIVLLPHYELVPPPASVGYVQTISNDVVRASPRLVPPPTEFYEINKLPLGVHTTPLFTE
jgi:hypothetical protein